MNANVAVLEREAPASPCAEELARINESLQARERLLTASARASRLLLEAADVRAAVEDSASGIRSAIAAGMQVVAVPNRDYPPPRDILASAQLVLDSLPELTVDLLGQLGHGDPAS